jgi:hypothetical protein
MSVVEQKEICEVKTIKDDPDFKAYIDSKPSGFKIISREYPDCEGKVLYSDTGDFSKWVRKFHPNVTVETQKADKKLLLRSGDYWLPLVFLSSDITLPIYLNMVANYLYEKMKGALKGEKARVHLSAMYENTSDGIIKKFEFEGDVDTLQKAITKFNLNKFLEE